MITLQDSIVINRPVDQVFAYLADLENAPKWQPGVLESRRLSDGPMGAGTQFREVARVMGRTFDTICEITEFERGRKLAFKSTSSAAIQYESAYTLEPQGDSTRLNVAGQIYLKGLWRLFEPLFAGEVKKESQAELKTIKSLVEAQA